MAIILPGDSTTPRKKSPGGGQSIRARNVQRAIQQDGDVVGGQLRRRHVQYPGPQLCGHQKTLRGLVDDPLILAWQLRRRCLYPCSQSNCISRPPHPPQLRRPRPGVQPLFLLVCNDRIPGFLGIDSSPQTRAKRVLYPPVFAAVEADNRGHRAAFQDIRQDRQQPAKVVLLAVHEDAQRLESLRGRVELGAQSPLKRKVPCVANNLRQLVGSENGANRSATPRSAAQFAGHRSHHPAQETHRAVPAR